MKNLIKLLGIAGAAIIIFSMAGCPDGRNNNGGNPGTDPTGTPVKTLTGITAEYTPTTEIFPDTKHDTLKEGLTVKAAYSDNTGKTLNEADYTLSGALAVGESVITVSYTEGGVTKTATFKVTVDALTHAHNWQFKSTTATCTEAGEELWECAAITPAHHEDRPVAALGHDYIWTPNDPADGEEKQVCSRDSSHIGETRRVVTTAADMTALLNSQPANTAATPYNIKLDVAALPWSTGGAAQTAFGGKYVNLDLSDSTFTTIGNEAFYNCTSLTGITIPASVTSITTNTGSSNGTFRGCTRLTSVTFAEGSQLTTIGSYTFYGCTGLTSVTIPEGVTSIGNLAFFGCTGLTSITIPEGVTSIGSEAFRGCTGLTSITIPEGVTSIGSGAFRGCTGLTSVTITEGVTSIGQTMFDGCTGLTSITIPASVTSISDWAFRGCTGLTGITIPASVTSIGNAAFQNCTGLTSITIPEGVTTIDNYAFQYCTGLTSITIGAGVTSIGTDAFRSCSSLTSVTIPSSVTSIGNGAFSNTAWFNSQPDGLVYAGKVLYTYKGTMPANTVINDIRADTVGIAESAFEDSNLTGITIPASVTSIGERAFYNCTGLTGIIIPNSVTSIGSEAFYNCTGLASITIPEGVTSIDERAFMGCTLVSVTFEGTIDSVTSIGSGAFPGNLRTTYLAANGGPGTYTRPSGSSSTWTKQ